ncbi:hypothetical protein ACGFH8_13830 [Micromonospora sp. NPDC049175]|uniref:hypothetical protein n=1 Tax=Micromonospora sp. NPDC049175 TaxID=3364266 RepID=UPI003712B856
MTAVEQLLDSIAGWELEDVLVPGYLDRDDGPPRFAPLADQLYLVLDGKYLLIESVGNRGQLSMRISGRIEVPAALLGEDEEFAVSSVGSLFLDTSDGNSRLAGVRYSLNFESDATQGTVRCIEFCFGGFNVLFADPMWHLGIRLGGAGAYDDWSAHDRDPMNSVRGFRWTPAK